MRCECYKCGTTWYVPTPEVRKGKVIRCPTCNTTNAEDCEEGETKKVRE